MDYGHSMTQSPRPEGHVSDSRQLNDYHHVLSKTFNNPVVSFALRISNDLSSASWNAHLNGWNCTYYLK